jgi:hypothetical protein
VHVRRAILLFAVVLALAAVVSSVSEPGRIPRNAAPAVEEPAPAPRQGVEQTGGQAVRFRVGEPATRRLETGRSGLVLVQSRRPGQVEVLGLGLEGFAEPGVPARFEVFEERPRRAEIRFTPIDGSETRAAGVLVFDEPRR